MHFIFKNLKSDEVGLIVNNAPPLRRAQSRKEKVYLAGRSGYLSWDDERTYDEFTQVIEGHFEPSASMSVEKLKTWLNGKGHFVDSRLPEGFYEAEIMHEVSLYEIAPNLYKFTFMIVCQPFLYLHEGQNKITISRKNELLNYQGTLDAEPRLKVYGAGEVTLTAGDKSLKFKIDVSPVEIDCARKVAWSGTSHVVTTGEYFMLNETTTFTWTGGITTVELWPNWRCL